MKKGSITIKTGQYVSMHCGYENHRAPEASGWYFFSQEFKTLEEIAQEKGWHKSRKYGWLCNQKHAWRRQQSW